MISDSYTALNALLASNSTLTALLGVYGGTSIPLIKGGILAEVETDLPAIVFEVEPSTKTNFLANDFFLINVYAQTSRESYLVAKTIIDEFNQCQNVTNGYNAYTTCSVLTQVTDPTSKQVNTPVEFRLVNM